MRILSFNQYPDFTPEREFKEWWGSKLTSVLAVLARLEPVRVIMVARRIRKCSTAQAKAYVDGL